MAQKMSGALKSMDAYPLQERIINALVSYLMYLQKMIWPSDLSILYPHSGNALPVWKGLLCGLILVGITFLVIRLLRQAPYLAVGWFWYLGTLVPVIGIVQVGSQAMADRYAYVPLIGIFIIVAWGLPEIGAKGPHRDKVLKFGAGLWISTLMVLTWNQLSHWKNNITIFEHAIEVTNNKYPDFALAHNNLGNALLADRKTEEAIFQYRMTIDLDPDFALAHKNLGNALLAGRKTEEAISHYRMAIKLKPDFAPAHYNFGNALFNQRKTEEAIFHYKKAIKLKPDFTQAQNNLKIVLKRLAKTGSSE